MVYKEFALKIKVLRRIGIGNMKLEDLGIKEGQYREFTKDEIDNLIFDR